jgi:hypothetical protein
VLASGSFDRTVCILDARQSTESAVRVSTGDAGATRGEEGEGEENEKKEGGEGEEGGECSVFYLCRGRVVGVLWACCGRALRRKLSRLSRVCCAVVCCHVCCNA